MQSRNAALQAATSTTFDVAIIGGGIVGAGIAQNAACRGMSVILIDKADFSSGTSSKTTKLIHGGLRYLEQFQFRLTRELCHERALLEQLAPHLVKDFSFILPISNKGKLFGLKAEAGLTLYDLLSSNVKGTRKHKRLAQKDVLGACPSLSSNKVSGGLHFHDCITNDTRLVLEVLKSAQSHGATIINYVVAQGFHFENNQISAIECRDRSSGQNLTIQCRSCINATGVWSDGLMKQLDKNWNSQVSPAKGTHIMLPSSAFETSTALFLPTDDGRYVFVVPWQRALMVGTTDTNYSGSLDNPVATEDEIRYLLDVLNSYGREDRKITRNDVIAAWAGLRPLVGEVIGEGDQKSTKNLSREHELFEGKGGIVGLIGGKLTNYRMLAEHAVDKVVPKLPKQVVDDLQPAGTESIMLGGWQSKEDYLTATAEISTRARKNSIEPATIDHLISSYGKDAMKVIEIVEGDSFLLKRICPDFPQIMAEVVYGVKHEMAQSLEDILFRRMRLGLIHQGQCLEAASKVARCVQAVMGWDENRTAAELKALVKTLEEHMNIQPAMQGEMV